MTKRVLLIKLTSMGDLMHALPALTDARSVFPDIEFDWVVDEAFAEVPGWHPAVRQVIHSAHRRWKKNLGQSIFNGQLRDFYRKLNADDYDVVIDAQNNLKSALIAGLRRGHSHGLDKASIREQPAHWAYHYHHPADKSQHAIERQRQLLAQAIGYDKPLSAPDYGIRRERMQLPDIVLPANYLVFVHNASWTTKLWPESHWHQLIKKAAQAGYHVLLPCGNDAELQRAERLAEHHDNAIALPKLPLSQIGAILGQAAGAVCCDTGLCHLAGILGVPSVSFYGPTSAALIGATGLNQQHLIARTDRFRCAPCYRRTCDFDGASQDMSACMDAFSAETAWDQLVSLMARRTGRI
jgi:heptosyltransferase I